MEDGVTGFAVVGAVACGGDDDCDDAGVRWIDLSDSEIRIVEGSLGLVDDFECAVDCERAGLEADVVVEVAENNFIGRSVGEEFECDLAGYVEDLSAGDADAFRADGCAVAGAEINGEGSLDFERLDCVGAGVGEDDIGIAADDDAFRGGKI